MTATCESSTSGTTSLIGARGRLRASSEASRFGARAWFAELGVALPESSAGNPLPLLFIGTLFTGGGVVAGAGAFGFGGGSRLFALLAETAGGIVAVDGEAAGRRLLWKPMSASIISARNTTEAMVMPRSQRRGDRPSSAAVPANRLLSELRAGSG